MRKDYQVKIGVRNGRIIQKMREVGIGSLAELARKAGINYTGLATLYQMRESPKGAKGEWRAIVLNLSSFFRCEPEDLFNEQQTDHPLKKTSAETFMDIHEVMAISSGGIEAVEAKLMVQQMLNGPDITCRESRILRQRFFEDMTLQDVGEEMGITRERVRHIECKALRKLKSAASGKSPSPPPLAKRIADSIPSKSPYSEPKRQEPPLLTPLQRRVLSRMEEIDRRVEALVAANDSSSGDHAENVDRHFAL